MRAIFVVALMALGLAFVGTSPISAAPANGSVIGNAAAVNQVVDQVHWRHEWRPHWRHHWRHHRHHHHHSKHCWWHRGHLHCGGW
jgi:hypothetical protein